MDRMDLAQAFNVLEQVCAAHHGTLQDHQLMQSALATAREAAYTQPAPPDPEGEPAEGAEVDPALAADVEGAFAGNE